MTEQQMARINKDKGQHWFDADTKRFFKSRVCGNATVHGHFVSSEKGPDNIRKYTIRRFDRVTGAVSTVGTFQAYRTLAQAQNALLRLEKGMVPS